VSTFWKLQVREKHIESWSTHQDGAKCKYDYNIAVMHGIEYNLAKYENTPIPTSSEI